MRKTYLQLLFVFIYSLMLHSCQKNGIDSPNPIVNQQQSFTVKGRLKNCSGLDITKGLIVVSCYSNNINYEYFFDSVFNGSFALSIQPVHTVDSVRVFAVDLTNLKLSDTLNYKLHDTLLNINTLNVCTSPVPEYFRYKVDNLPEEIYTPLYGDSLNLMSWNYTGGEPMTSFQRKCNYNCKAVEFQFDGYAVGTFSVTGRDRILINPWYSFNMPNIGSITYTTYGSLGQYVVGSMNVPFVDNTDSLHHVLTGSFRLKRKNHL